MFFPLHITTSSTDLPEMPDFLREVVNSGENKELPGSITSLVDNSSKTKCRISWKSLITGFQSHGDWFDRVDEQMLQSNVNAMNIKYAGELTHWIEYQ